MTRRFLSALTATLLCLAIVGEAKAEETLCDGLLKVYRSGKTGFYDLIERRLADHEIDPEKDVPGSFVPNIHLPGAEHCAIGPRGRFYYCMLSGTKEPDEAQVFLSQTFAGMKSCFMENEPGDWMWRYRTRGEKSVRIEPKSWYYGLLFMPYKGEPSVAIQYEQNKRIVIGLTCTSRCKQ